MLAVVQPGNEMETVWMEERPCQSYKKEAEYRPVGRIIISSVVGV